MKYLDIEGRTVPTPTYDYDVSKLVEQYRSSITTIKQRLERVDIVGLDRARSLVLLKEIGEELKKLDDGASSWVDANISKSIQDGIASTLVNLELADTVSEANAVVKFNKLNRALAEAAVADTQSDLLQITQNVDRKIRNTVREVVAEVMRNNLSANVNNVPTLKRDILTSLRAKLGSALDTGIIDAANRKWRPEVYADMIARTKMHETYRQAKQNEAAQRGAQYAIISKHNAVDACRYHESRIIKLDPNAEGDYPTYDELKASSQIFHPNCRHSYTVVRKLDRLPPDILDRAKEQHNIGTAAQQLGKRSPAEEDVIKIAKSNTIINSNGSIPSQAITQNVANTNKPKYNLNTDSLKGQLPEVNRLEIQSILDDAVVRAPEPLLRLWEQRSKYIKIDDFKSDKAHYNPNTRGVHFNLEATTSDSPTSQRVRSNHKKYNYFFHEVGHMFDGYVKWKPEYDSRFMSNDMIDGFSPLGMYSAGRLKDGSFAPFVTNMHGNKVYNKSGLFNKQLIDDVKLVIESAKDGIIEGGLKFGIQVERDNITLTGVKNYLSPIFRKYVEDGYEISHLSDIFEGVTRGDIHFEFGHGAEYWEVVPPAMEAFAEFFEATMTNSTGLELIKKYLPNSYEVFIKLCEEMTE